MNQRVWTVVVAIGIVTILIKSTGPVLFGGRELPPRMQRLVVLLAPALLAALVATQVFGGPERQLRIDERVLGLVAAAIALALRVPALVAVLAAAVVTALVRAL